MPLPENIIILFYWTAPCGNAFFDGCSLLRTTEYALWKKIIVYRGFPERVF